MSQPAATRPGAGASIPSGGRRCCSSWSSALIALTALLFSGTLQDVVPLTLVSDRAGLVMENGAKVKLRGVQIGEVETIGAEVQSPATDLSKLKLKIDPGPFQYLPSNVEAEIKSSTAFGAKYVDLIVPADGASAEPLKPGVGAALPQRDRRGQHRVPESAVGGAVDRPGEAELGAVGGGRIAARQGRCHRAGDHRRQQRAARRQSADGDRPAGLAAVRPDRRRRIRMRRRTSCRSWIRSRRPARRSPHTRRRSTRCCCRRSDSPSPESTRSAAISPIWCARSTPLVPTTELLNKYSPTYTCLFHGRPVVPGERWPRCVGRQR